MEKTKFLQLPENKIRLFTSFCYDMHDLGRNHTNKMAVIYHDGIRKFKYEVFYMFLGYNDVEHRNILDNIILGRMPKFKIILESTRDIFPKVD